MALATKPARGIEILLCDSRGVYIPRDFAIECVPAGWTIDPDNLATLLVGPDADWYWEAWDMVLDTSTVQLEVYDKASDTRTVYTYRLHQDGDLFAICDELMTDEERSNFEAM